MRSFSPYGPIDTDDNYYAPRTELIQKAAHERIGNP